MDSITRNQDSLVDHIVARLSSLNQMSTPGAGASEGVIVPPTLQLIISPEILPGLQGDSSTAKAHVSSVVKVQALSAKKAQTSVTNPQNNLNDYHTPDFDEEDKAKKIEEKIKLLEDQMKTIKGEDNYYGVDAIELSLASDLIIPSKFKESLSGSGIRWYNQLNRSHIKTWKDLAKYFLEQYKHVNDMRPDRVMLHLVIITSGNFYDLIMTEEMIEITIKQEKIDGGESSKRPPMKKKEVEINNINTSKGVTTSKSKPTTVVPLGTSRQDAKEPMRKNKYFEPIPMAYKELYQHLFETHVVSSYLVEPLKPSYPKCYDENTYCEYHGGVPRHAIENCLAFKRIVQRMSNRNWIHFNNLESPNIAQNPLSNHQESGVNVIINEKVKRVKTSVSEVKSPLAWVWRQMVRAELLVPHPNTSEYECELEFYEEDQDTPEVDIYTAGDSPDKGFGVNHPLIIVSKVKVAD
ncbi:uncharacterized protein LOC120138915 [Hibiscus syriacus]|uniref:uncharacterized protein LOC120138915 n=1 Tax=Hibiscus syriacus TaxID=106335 RepID=UPI00192048D5|nr:uncharacterized protein LOC120138915 [Hibiscus syriacus]